MATETVASSVITNRDASPRVPSDLRVGGRSFTKRAWLHVSVADVSSIYKMFPVPSNAVVESVRLSTSADMGTTTTFKISLYDTTANGGAVVTNGDGFFGTGIITNAGAITKKECLLLGTVTVATSDQKLWQQLSATSDPQKDYDVYLITDGACDGAADVLLEMDYKLV